MYEGEKKKENEKKKKTSSVFFAEAHTPMKSSGIDFTARENLCSIFKLLSAIHRDRRNKGESIKVKKSNLI